jgi:hypothetical protein
MNWIVAVIIIDKHKIFDGWWQEIFAMKKLSQTAQKFI